MAWKNKSGERMYIFDWVGGGFNSVWAKTKKDALKKAEDNYLSLKVNKATLKSVTYDEYVEWSYTSDMYRD